MERKLSAGAIFLLIFGLVAQPSQARDSKFGGHNRETFAVVRAGPQAVERSVAPAEKSSSTRHDAKGEGSRSHDERDSRPLFRFQSKLGEVAVQPALGVKGAQLSLGF